MSAGEEQAVGGIQVALAHCARLCVTRPRLAEAQVAEILLAAPGHPEALRLLALARRQLGDITGSATVLRALVDAQPDWALAHYDLALTLTALLDHSAATAALRRAVRLKPQFSEAWSALGQALILAGDPPGADQAFARQISAATRDPRLIAAATALCDDRLDVAERLLRPHLKLNPGDVAAIRMLAEVGTRLGQYADAELLLERCLELAPGFTAARHNYAIVLYRQSKAVEVLPQIGRLLETEPAHPGYRNLQAAALALGGDYDQSICAYEAVLKDHPNQPKVWLSYGHSLKTAGRQADAVVAYRRCIAASPGCGEAYGA
jgi:predicted Zn-dependent protease